MGKVDEPSMAVVRDCEKTAAYWAQTTASFDSLSKPPEEFKVMRLM